MSGGLAPSKSTVYASNLPFSLTSSDLNKIFEKYGRVAKVTVLKDRQTRKSKGVAFVLFIQREDAWACVRALNNTIMFDRTITCSIAKDNGRTPEFIKRKEYTDKSKCYECGQPGHLSLECPKNLLGDRVPPPKKKKKTAELPEEDDTVLDTSDIPSTSSTFDNELAAAIERNAELGYFPAIETEPKRKTYKKDGYFSDEEELSD